MSFNVAHQKCWFRENRFIKPTVLSSSEVVLPGMFWSQENICLLSASLCLLDPLSACLPAVCLPPLIHVRVCTDVCTPMCMDVCNLDSVQLPNRLPVCRVDDQFSIRWKFFRLVAPTEFLCPLSQEYRILFIIHSGYQQYLTVVVSNFIHSIYNSFPSPLDEQKNDFGS